MRGPFPALDPELRWRAFLTPRATFNARTVRIMRRLTALGRGRVADGVDARDTPHGRLFTPVAAGARRPALLWMHGGGYLIGSPALETEFASHVAHDLGISVLAVRYRLAPEHRAPAQLHDCYAALEWLTGTEGIDPSRVAVGGESAGGGLAAGVAQLALDRGGPPIAFQLLVYPMLDDRTCLRDELDARPVVMWNTSSNRYAWGSYLGRPPGSSDVSASVVPARRDDLAGLPAAWIGVGDIDLFLDEDVEYARRLTEAGVPCTVEVVRGAFHGFDRVARRTSIARSFTDAKVEALRQGLGLSGARAPAGP